MAKSIYKEPEIFQNLLKNLNEQRKIGKYCDYTLKTEDNGNFPVHKCVLESTSPFFYKMFNSQFNDKEKDTVVMRRCSTSEILDKIIEFMYTGEIEITFEEAKDILDASLFIGLNNLVNACTKVLLENVTIENCFDLLSYSETYFSGESLTNECIKIICKNIEIIMNSSKFYEMSLESMLVLCLNDEKFAMMNNFIKQL